VTLFISSVRITVATADGVAEYNTSFDAGLNVINAPNSWGKSTLMQAIMYALGLEGSQTASRRSPLGPAMTTVLETAQGRHAVVESFVTLTVTNHNGQYLRVRRWGQSEDVKRDLLHVWRADNEAGLDNATFYDFKHLDEDDRALMDSVYDFLSREAVKGHPNKVEKHARRARGLLLSPPGKAPEQCTNPLMWDLSYLLLCAHWQDDKGVCATCPSEVERPCRGRRLAIRGLVESLQLRDFELRNGEAS
jgi:hypothetical protein